jgi:hypothetical protein
MVGVYNTFYKNVGDTSKFYFPKGRYEASSIHRTPDSVPTFDLDCNVARFARCLVN